MKRSITRWTTTLAAAALLAMPATGWAQTASQQPAQTATAAESQTPQASTPEEHLRLAKTSLEKIEPNAVTGKAKTQIAELKRHLNALERATGANASASATGAAQKNPRATDPRGNAKWSTEVAAIDKILANLLDSGSAATGTSGTTGTAGATAVTLDEATSTALTEVRQHVTKFAAAMSGTAGSGDPSAATGSTATGSTAATGTTTGSTTTGSMTGSSATGSTTGTPATATDPQTAGQTAAPQADADAARRYLTEARDTLSEMTQLPAAAQLSGDARTQVSQLISNFNELITAQSEWKASFDKVEANLTALIGPEDPTVSGTATGTVTGTAGTGAVGTSGTAATSIDPTLRTKLVELRAKLNEFERAVSGGAPASGTASSPAAGTMTGATTGAAGTTAQNPEAGAPKTEQMGHSEALRHIEAIEAILNANAPSAAGTAGTSATTTTGTAGTTAAPSSAASVTLTPAQLNELRTHLTELKKLVNQADRK